MNFRLRELAGPAALALLVGLAFGGAVGNGYVQWDDPLFVTGSPAVVHGLSWEGVRWAFEANLTRADTRVEYWIPITGLSRLVDAEFGGMRAGWVHGMSVLYHLAAALLVFAAFRRMGVSAARSWFVAALFALHPVQVEAVCWASGRKDVLGGLFWAATMWVYALYARRPSRARYLALVGVFLCGLMAKPSVLTLPAALLLLDLWPLGRLGREPVLRLVLEKTPLALLSGVSLWMSVLAQIDHGGLKPLELYPVPVRLGNAVLAYAGYLRSFVWPVDLAPIYPHPGTAIRWGAVAAAAVLLLSVSTAACRLGRRAPWFFAGWFWFLGSLVPMLGLVQLGGAARADRYLYSAILGLCWLAVESVARVAGPRGSRFAAAAGFAAVLACGWLSARQVARWRDTFTLFEHTVRVTGPNRQAHLSLAIAAFAQGDLKRAEAEAARSLAIHDANPPAWILLGKSALQKGEDRKALWCFEAVAQIDPADAQAQVLIGQARARLGDAEGAVAAYLRAAELRPQWARPLRLAAAVREQQGDRAAAERLRAEVAGRPVGGDGGDPP